MEPEAAASEPLRHDYDHRTWQRISLMLDQAGVVSATPEGRDLNVSERVREALRELTELRERKRWGRRKTK